MPERIAILPAFLQLAPVKRRDPFCRETQSGQILGAPLGAVARSISAGLTSSAAARQTQPVEQPGVTQQRPIALFLHGGDDFCHAPLDVAFAVAAPRQEFVSSSGLKPRSDVLTNLIFIGSSELLP